MRRWFEGVCYYLSCMTLFNLLYALLIFSTKNRCNFMFIFCLFLTTAGIFTTVYILIKDDSQDETYVTGKKFEVLTVENQTSDNYFTNFSLIVLASISLPTNQNLAVFLLLILIEISLGIVYINESIYYMNPILSLSGYRIYRCTGRDPINKHEYDGFFYFVVRGIDVKVGTVIKFKNINKHVIRINKK